MARYKSYDSKQGKFIPVSYVGQILPGLSSKGQQGSTSHEGWPCSFLNT